MLDADWYDGLTDPPPGVCVEMRDRVYNMHDFGRRNDGWQTCLGVWLSDRPTEWRIAKDSACACPVNNEPQKDTN